VLAATVDLGWRMVFDGWAPVVRTLVLGTLAYVSLVFLLRVSGKRTLSKMNALALAQEESQSIDDRLQRTQEDQQSSERFQARRPV